MAPMDLRSRESMERFIQQYQQRATTLPVDTLAMLAQQARFGTGAAAAATELGESILPRARPEQEGAQAQIRQQQAAAARRGQIIDRTTERVLTAQIAGAEALNSLKSAALGAAEQLGILRGVAEAAAAAAGVASAGAGGLSGITGTMGGALLAGGGLAAGYLATKIGPLLTAFRLARMIPGAPALPALSNLFGRGAAPSAGGTSALGRMGSMGGMLGTAGGVAGVGLGGYQAATGESRADRMMGIGGALASGALTGAMLGGVPGAVIGGVLGGGSALLANMFANPNQPAGTPAPSPVAPAAPQLSSLMENYWGERSALITVLNGILSSNNEIKSLTQRVVNNTA